MIEKVIAYSEGLRLIMLSATPMFNKSTEIIWLLNLLLKNDNRPLITSLIVPSPPKARMKSNDSKSSALSMIS